MDPFNKNSVNVCPLDYYAPIYVLKAKIIITLVTVISDQGFPDRKIYQESQEIGQNYTASYRKI